ncbi:MAG: hypothetical protein U0270_15615 [Labilithrix sp.]
MARPRVRPTFELSVGLSAREVVGRITSHLSDAAGSIEPVMIRDQIVELVPHSSIVHLWSPQLRLELKEVDGHTDIHARFSPHPHVWTLYVAIHAVGAFGTVAAAVFGLSQHLAGQASWALWALPMAPVFAALVWALAFVGQGLGAEQMYALRRFVEEAVERSAGKEQQMRAALDPSEH